MTILPKRSFTTLLRVSIFKAFLNNNHMHHNNFTAAVGKSFSKWLGKRCWLPFIAQHFVGSHYLVFPSVQRCVFAERQCDRDNDGSWSSHYCQLSGMLHFIEVTETEKWSRHWNDSVAVLPQCIVTVCSEWSHWRKERRKEKEMTDWLIGFDFAEEGFFLNVSVIVF